MSELAIERHLPGARVVFSTRLGGVSDGPFESLNLGIMTGDERSRVGENRRRLLEDAGAEQLVMSRQVHGIELVEHERAPAELPPLEAGHLPEADGHLTSLAGLAMLVLVADCLPVVLAAPSRLAVLHCGWRGLAGGIVERALGHFDELPSAAIGPGIGGCCYEVGDEVRAAFDGLDGVARGRMLDLRAVVRRKLATAGVERVEDVDLCTSCRADLFFSHRRDDGVTGRQAGLAWLE